MNPEIQALADRVNELEIILGGLIKSDRYTIQRTIQMLDGRNIQLAQGTGTKIATTTTQKLGFYGTTPVVQQVLAANNLNTLQNALDFCVDIRTKLKNVGIITY